MKSNRGLVINPGATSLGPDAFQISIGAEANLLRRCLLYWDRIEWPENNLVGWGNSPDTELLKSAGILQRTRVEFVGRFTGDLTPVFAQGQLKVFELLEKREPGTWSIAQASERLQFPGSPVTERRSVEVELYDLLPAPADNVPFEDILEFRQRYSAELLALRGALDRMYLEISNASDPERVKTIARGEISEAVQNVERAMGGRSMASWRSSFSVDIRVPDIAKYAAGGAAIASLFGVPVALGAGLGAVTGALKLSIARVPTPNPVRTGPFAYLYRVKRELTR